MRPRSPILVLLLLVGGSFARVGAQPVTDAIPVYHGVLTVRPAGGPFDVHTGNATLRVRRWDFTLGRDERCIDTNGVFPDREPVVVAIGEDQFPLAAGALRGTRRGKVFVYRAADQLRRGIKALRITKGTGSAYSLRLTVTGLDLSRLMLNDPGCVPMAVIVGDDDVFTNILVSRQSFSAPRFRVLTQRCIPAGDDWPWTTGGTCRAANVRVPSESRSAAQWGVRTVVVATPSFFTQVIDSCSESVG